MGSKDKKSSSPKSSKTKKRSEEYTPKKPESIRIQSLAKKSDAPYRLVPVKNKYGNMYRLVVEGSKDDRKFFSTTENAYLSSSGIQLFKDDKPVITAPEDKYDIAKSHPEYDELSNVISTGKVSITINDKTQDFYDQYIRFMNHVKDAVCEEAAKLKENGDMKPFFKKLDASMPEEFKNIVSYPEAKDKNLLSWSLSNFVNFFDTTNPDETKPIETRYLIGKLFKAWYVIEVTVTFFSDANGNHKIYIKPFISTAFIKKRTPKTVEYEFVDE